MQMEYKTINKEIRERRILKNITVREMAKLSGVSPTTIVNFENGADARFSKVQGMLAVLDCTFEVKEK